MISYTIPLDINTNYIFIDKSLDKINKYTIHKDTMTELVGTMDTAFIEDVEPGFSSVSKRAQFIERLSAKLASKMNCKKITRKLIKGNKKSVVRDIQTKQINKLELDVKTGRKNTVRRAYSLPKRGTYMNTQRNAVEFNYGQFANIGDIVCCYI